MSQVPSIFIANHLMLALPYGTGQAHPRNSIEVRVLQSQKVGASSNDEFKYIALGPKENLSILHLPSSFLNKADPECVLLQDSTTVRIHPARGRINKTAHMMMMGKSFFPQFLSRVRFPISVSSRRCKLPNFISTFTNDVISWVSYFCYFASLVPPFGLDGWTEGILWQQRRQLPACKDY